MKRVAIMTCVGSFAATGMPDALKSSRIGSRIGFEDAKLGDFQSICSVGGREARALRPPLSSVLGEAVSVAKLLAAPEIRCGLDRVVSASVLQRGH